MALENCRAYLTGICGESGSVAAEVWIVDRAAVLGNYLPLAFKSPKEQEYIEFMWDAFEMNYTHANYPAAVPSY